MQYVLGIETSCDDTAVALYEAQKGIRAECVYSQVVHAKHGGVVPELAARDHIRLLGPLFTRVLAEAALTPKALEAIAYTRGPGLVGALLTGAGFARSLAYGLNIPALGVHHLEGHLLAPMLEDSTITFPFLGLIVSGGHTLFVHAKALGSYAIVGESLDDAAGEAFDKTARLLGLGQGGGAALAALALQGDPARFHFPRPMLHQPGCDVSFSGLKTHARLVWESLPQNDSDRADVARAFEDAVIDVLITKSARALIQTGLARLVIAGGVSANTRLRTVLQRYADTQDIAVHYAKPALCTDNAAMIAYVGYLRLREGVCDSLDFSVRARWPLDSLLPPQAM